MKNGLNIPLLLSICHTVSVTDAKLVRPFVAYRMHCISRCVSKSTRVLITRRLFVLQEHNTGLHRKTAIYHILQLQHLTEETFNIIYIYLIFCSFAIMKQEEVIVHCTIVHGHFLLQLCSVQILKDDLE